MTRFIDRLTLDAGRRTADGYFVASVKAARTGIQLYSGRDVGKPDMTTVRVYRPENEVFHRDSLSSFAFRPVTIEHPRDGVNATNWRDLGRGITGGDIVRDGDFVRVSLAVMDEAAIKVIEDGKRQISMGYDAVLEFVDGTTPNGEQYDAVQHNIRMNHLAIVDAARGGSELRIGDIEEEPNMANKIVMVDGLSVETTEAGAQAIDKLQRDVKTLQDRLTAEITAKDKRIGELTADVAKKDGELAVAKKSIEDGVLTPAKLDAAVIARTALITDARKIAGDDLVVDGKTDLEIRRAAIAVKLGDDEAKKMSDASIEGAFAFAAKQSDGTSSHSTSSVQPLREALGRPQVQMSSEDAYEAYSKSLSDAWKTPGKQPAAN